MAGDGAGAADGGVLKGWTRVEIPKKAGKEPLYREVNDWRNQPRPGIKSKRKKMGRIARRMLRAMRKGEQWPFDMMRKNRWTLKNLNTWAKDEWYKGGGGSLSREARGMREWNRRKLDE